MNIPFVTGNPIYILIAFLVFYFLIAKPLLKFDFFKSLLIFIVLYVLYQKFGKSLLNGSSFGKRRKH